MEYKDHVVWLLTEILKAIKAQRPKKRNRRVQGDLWVRGKKLDRIDVAQREWEESQERLRHELEQERARKNSGTNVSSATTEKGDRRSVSAGMTSTRTLTPEDAGSSNGSADAASIAHREAKHGVVNGEAAKVAEQLMARNKRMMG